MPKAHVRKRRNQSEWTEILRRFESASVTVRDFCRREDLSLSSFQRWQSRLGSVGPAEFVELVPTETASSADWSLDIVLPNGAQLRFRG